MMTPILTKELSADGFTWNQYSPRVATIANELTQFATVAYFAFDSWDEAHAFWKSVTEHRLCTRAQVRESERFTTHNWEVKVWGMSAATLDQLIWRDRNRTPKSLPLPQVRRDWSLSDSYSAIAWRCGIRQRRHSPGTAGASKPSTERGLVWAHSSANLPSNAYSIVCVCATDELGQPASASDSG